MEDSQCYEVKCKESQPCCKCAQSRGRVCCLRYSLMKHIPLNNIHHCYSEDDAPGLCLGASQHSKCPALGLVPGTPDVCGELCGTTGDQQLTGGGRNPPWVSRLSHKVPSIPVFLSSVPPLQQHGVLRHSPAQGRVCAQMA